ncbi:MAG: dihydroorotate dehydrogenase, partial [bacterium]
MSPSPQTAGSASPDLTVALGRLTLPNPILVASGTFGYGREMTGFVALARLGGIVPKTITPLPRQGNVPWR